MSLQISGHGCARPTALLIGDIPLKEDISTGYALSGTTRRTLIDMMTHNQLNIEDFYCTSLFNNQATDSGKKYAQNKQNLADITGWTEQLKHEIEFFDTPLLIPLGELAFRAITNLKGIRKFRG